MSKRVLGGVIILCILIWVVIILSNIMYKGDSNPEQSTTNEIYTDVSISSTDYTNEDYQKSSTQYSGGGMSDMSIQYETKKSDTTEVSSKAEIDMSSSEKSTEVIYKSDIDWSGGELYNSELNTLLDITSKLLYAQDNNVLCCYIASSDDVVKYSMLNNVGYFVDEDGTLYLNLRIVYVDGSESFKTVGLYYDKNVLRLMEV